MDTSNSKIKEQIIEYSKEIGIDKIGFTSAKPFTDLRKILIKHRELGYESGFEEKDIDKRTNPKLILKAAKSIISIAVAYPNKVTNISEFEKESRGFVSCSAWGTDYHLILEDKLSKLGEFLKKLDSNAEYVYMTDMGVLSDRAVAERAGLGWIGKNSLLITPEYGSYVFLGEIITNLIIKDDKPIKEECGECTLCIEACPNQALVGAKQLNSTRCLSFLTQKKNILEEKHFEKLGNRLYGCDTCQQVCPKNKGINSLHQKQFIPDPDLARPLLRPLLKLTNKDFNKRWGYTAAGWRGKTIIQRNAIICLAHKKEYTAIPELQKLLSEDNREIIRHTAAWAIKKIEKDSV